MTDDHVLVRQRALDVAILTAAALGLVGLVVVWLTGSWQGGFVAGQTASRILPPWLWEILTTLGDARVQVALLLPFCWRYPRVFWALVLGALFAGLISRGIKMSVPLPRPAAILPPEQITIIGAHLTAHSFPSGHTVSAFSFIVAWLALLGWRAWPFVLLAGLAGFSRVAVGAHWPVDVLAGMVIGLLGGWVGLRLSTRWRWGAGKAGQRLLIGIALIAVCTLPFDGQGYPDTFAWRMVAALWALTGFARYSLWPAFGRWQARRRKVRGELDSLETKP